MKAVILEANERLTYKDMALPEVGFKQVRIKIAVCGICGSDIPRVFDHGAHNYPIVLGHEFSGTVDAVGEGISDFNIGDRVVAAPLIPCHDCPDCRLGNYSLCSKYSFVGSRQQGAMADYVVVPAVNVLPISEGVSFEQAATIEPSTVALHALRIISYAPGKRVAVLGCGIIGLYAVQWVKLLGAESVTAIGRDEAGLQAAKAAGANEVFSTLNVNETELLAKLNKSGYDYVIECVGAEQTFHLALQMVAKKGTVCMVGTPKKDISFTPVVWENLNRKECWVTGSWMSYSVPFPGDEWRMSVEYMESGKLKLLPNMIYKVFSMKEAAEAFAAVRNGAVGRCLLSNM